MMGFTLLLTGLQGFYPVCPGTPEYVIGTPLFKKVQMELPNGEKLIIEASGTENTTFIRKASLRVKALNKSYLTHQELLKGGRLVFEMGAEPEKSLWSSPESYPSSVSLISE